MTTATLSLPTTYAETTPRKSWLARFHAAIIEARMRTAMRELERHRHLIPDDMLKSAGYEATATKDGALPFTR